MNSVNLIKGKSTHGKHLHERALGKICRIKNEKETNHRYRMIKRIVKVSACNSMATNLKTQK